MQTNNELHPNHLAAQPALSRRQLATILAALRYWQARDCAPLPSEQRDALDDIATASGAMTSLTAREIDHLCERLNRS
jgi:hypothetical protein